MSEENKTQEIKLYELGYHLTSSISEDKVPAKIDGIKKVLSDNSAEIVKEGAPKLIDLAYEIVNHIAGKNQKFTNAYFGWIKFNASAEGIEKIKESIDSDTEIIRSLIIKTVDDDDHSTAKIMNAEEEKVAKKLEAEEEATEEDEESVEVAEEEVEAEEVEATEETPTEEEK